MDRAERVDRIARSTEELLTREELEQLLDSHERPRAYIGFEPSGRLTVGQLVCVRKMRDLQEAGCELTVLLADWHAWINDKLDGSLERILESGRRMQAAFDALGLDPATTRYRWAHELVGNADYWARVVRVAKATSLARTKRAMTVLGRSEEESKLDTAKLLYPAMQVADIFELPVEIAFAGIDQRRAHVLAREAAHHYGWPVPVALHTPLVPSLKGTGRMDASADPSAGKMSKSDPGSAIGIPAEPSEVERKITAAFCPAKEVEGNPVLALAEQVVLPWLGALEVDRPSQYGGPRRFEGREEVRTAWRSGELHPADLKRAVAAGLTTILRPTERLGLSLA